MFPHSWRCALPSVLVISAAETHAPASLRHHSSSVMAVGFTGCTITQAAGAKPGREVSATARTHLGGCAHPDFAPQAVGRPVCKLARSVHTASPLTTTLVGAIPRNGTARNDTRSPVHSKLGSPCSNNTSGGQSR